MTNKNKIKYRFENVNCLEVVDGDTIRTHINLGFNISIFETFRLYRINAPESRTRDKKEKERGLETKQFLKNLIEGKPITIETHKAEKYGRWLAEVFFEGKNVNDLLVKEGLAIYKDYEHAKGV